MAAFILRDASLRDAPQDEAEKSQRSAARIVWSAPGTPSSQLHPPLSNKYRGRAGRCRVQTDPRASTSRDIEAYRPASLLAKLRRVKFRKSASPKASRARCFRLAPRRFPVVERLRALRRLSTVEDQALGRSPSDGGPGLPAVRALDPHAERAGSFAAWTAGPCQRISAATSFPGHRSPPRV